MKICTKCVLPDTFPGINFDAQGICNFCRDFKGEEALKEEKKEYYAKFLELIKEVKGKSDYDCTLSYSGGKDSTYTLYLLKKIFKLKPLTITFDNGFISEQAFKNIRTVTENLGVDSIVFKPDFQLLKKIFVAGIENTMYSAKALERASTICTSCIGLVKFTALKIALEKKIPLMAWGWSPGQAPIRSSIMKINPTLFKTTQETYRKPMHDLVGDEINLYFLTDEQFKNTEEFPYNVSPLAFMDYNEQKIIKKIDELGWSIPKGLDSNSTNCLLNSFANQIHIKKYAFHPYAFEIAGMVRNSDMSREEGLEKVYKNEENPSLISLTKKKLKSIKALFSLLDNYIKVLKRIIESGRYDRFTIAEYFRKQGAQIGEGCSIIPRSLGDEPYLVKIGNNVTIAHGVLFATHDGGTWIFRDENPDLQVFGPIVIEDNCVIGANAVLFCNIRIGKNSIVGAGSVVITDIPPNSIAIGVPARIMGSIDKYKEKCIARWKEQKPPDCVIEENRDWWTSSHLKENREKLKKHLMKLFCNL